MRPNAGKVFGYLLCALLCAFLWLKWDSLSIPGQIRGLAQTLVCKPLAVSYLEEPDGLRHVGILVEDATPTEVDLLQTAVTHLLCLDDRDSVRVVSSEIPPADMGVSTALATLFGWLFLCLADPVARRPQAGLLPSLARISAWSLLLGTPLWIWGVQSGALQPLPCSFVCAIVLGLWLGQSRMHSSLWLVFAMAMIPATHEGMDLVARTHRLAEPTFICSRGDRTGIVVLAAKERADAVRATLGSGTLVITK